MANDIYVLGTGLSHDGSVCLLKNGRIQVAIEKERITRRKHDGGNDTDAIRYVLDAAGIAVSDLALVVQNANFHMFDRGNGFYEGPRILDERVPVRTISHHLAHAYSAMATSPFDRGAVLIIDGCGNAFGHTIDRDGARLGNFPAPGLEHLYFEKDSYYQFEGKELRTVYKDFSPWGHQTRHPMTPPTTMHSIGGIYSAVSRYVFSNIDDVGKLMGLGPYGRPGMHDFPIFDLHDGQAFVRYDWMDRFNAPTRGFDDFKRRFQEFADLAWWIQRELERAILYVVGTRHEMAPAENLAYAGGVALNAVANRRIVTEGPFENLFIQPAAGDNGLALGCAYYGWLNVLGEERVPHDGTSAFGRSYRKGEILDALHEYSPLIRYHATSSYIDRTVELLTNGKVVAWFQGGSEFGPRALGHRSILADPRNPEVRDFINANIKFREDFRPFAPSVLAEDAPVYFDCDYDSPYMILVAPVRPEWRERIPSVVHRDHSARIQTVTEELDPTYAALLRSFKNVSGISVLLNTSFNRRGMPIVETPRQAVEFFLECDLDALVIDNYIVTKN